MLAIERTINHRRTSVIITSNRRRPLKYVTRIHSVNSSFRDFKIKSSSSLSSVVRQQTYLSRRPVSRSVIWGDSNGDVENANMRGNWGGTSYPGVCPSPVGVGSTTEKFWHVLLWNGAFLMHSRVRFRPTILPRWCSWHQQRFNTNYEITVCAVRIILTLKPAKIACHVLQCITVLQ